MLPILKYKLNTSREVTRPFAVRRSARANKMTCQTSSGFHFGNPILEPLCVGRRVGRPLLCARQSRSSFSISVNEKATCRRNRKKVLNASVERCRSGRTGRSRKPLWVQAYPGFESLSLRQFIKSPTVPLQITLGVLHFS